MNERILSFLFYMSKCHEPFKTLGHLSFNDEGNLVCSVCKTESHPYVNFPRLFFPTQKYINRRGLPRISPTPTNFPLFWNVVINEIEKKICGMGNTKTQRYFPYNLAMAGCTFSSSFID